MIGRTAWTATKAPGSALRGPLKLVVIHHSYRPDLPADASEAEEIAAIRGVDDYHRDEQGWAGAGYSFAVFQSGRAYELRGWLHSGAHTQGQNSRSHGICFFIDGGRHTPTPAAIKAVCELLGDGIRRGAVAHDYEIHGHDEYQQKDCPGVLVKAVFDQLRPNGGARPRLLKLGARGVDVSRLQIALGMQPTGYYGALTQKRVKEFQEANGLADDGIVGPLTRAKLPGGI